MMCADYDVPIGPDGICPECHIPHDMQSLYILKAGNFLPPKPNRVLLVEDDAEVRHALARYLGGKGYQVSQESNGHSAFETYRERFPFVFVISDFEFIPGQRVSSCGVKIRHGADLAREIRKLIPKQRMALMSGDHRAAEAALDESVKDVTVLIKPFRLLELLGVIQKT
jgi:CheY-like chemotaxis protein